MNILHRIIWRQRNGPMNRWRTRNGGNNFFVRSNRIKSSRVFYGIRSCQGCQWTVKRLMRSNSLDSHNDFIILFHAFSALRASLVPSVPFAAVKSLAWRDVAWRLVIVFIRIHFMYFRNYVLFLNSTHTHSTLWGVECHEIFVSNL